MTRVEVDNYNVNGIVGGDSESVAVFRCMQYINTFFHDCDNGSGTSNLSFRRNYEDEFDGR